MQAKKLNIPPAFLTTAAANILNCNITSLAGPVGFTMSQPYILVKHMRVMNLDTSSAHVISVYKGATAGSAAGTQLGWAGTSLPALGYQDWYGEVRLDSADFLTGICDAASKVVINIDAEIGVSG